MLWLGGVAAAAMAAAAVSAAATAPRGPWQVAPLSLLPISTGLTNPIGIDHHEPSNGLVASVYYPQGVPYNLDLVFADGSRQRFSDVAGLKEELKIAAVRRGPCQGGFEAGAVFSGTGVDGQILRVSPDGGVADVPWVTLPGGTGLMRGGLFQDRYCVVAGDLVVVTTSGEVWRVSSDAAARKIAGLGVHLEGVTTVPDEAVYGPWAGKILTGSEKNGLIYAIDPEGDVTSWRLGINEEDVDVVPARENFYGIDFSAGIVYGALAADFADKQGGLVFAQESGVLFFVRWQPEDQVFGVARIATVSHWEHVTFSPAGIVEIPTPPAVPTVTATASPPPPPSPTPAPIYLPAYAAGSCLPGRDRLAVLLLMDASTSMLEAVAPGRPDTKMDAAREAARGLLDRLRMPPDQGAIAWFNLEAGIPQTLTSDRGALDRALAGLRNRQYTRLDRGVARARKELLSGRRIPGHLPVMVVLTDGRANPVPVSAAVAEAGVAKAAGITVFTVGLGPAVEEQALMAMATAPDYYAHASGAEDLPAVFGRIGASLACGRQ